MREFSEKELQETYEKMTGSSDMWEEISEEELQETYEKMTGSSDMWEDISEEELQEAYKNEKRMEIPDMWEEIERNLAPKRKKVIPIKKAASLVAMFALVVLSVSVLRRIGTGGGTGMLAMKESASSTDESVINADIVQENAEDTEEDMTMDNRNEGVGSNEIINRIPEMDHEANKYMAEDDEMTESDMADSTAVEEQEPQVQETQSSKPDREQESERTDEESVLYSEGNVLEEDTKQQELQVQVKIQEVEQRETYLAIKAQVLEVEHDVSLEKEIEILANSEEYFMQEFAGIMKLRIQKLEENFKLLEIL